MEFLCPLSPVHTASVPTAAKTLSDGTVTGGLAHSLSDGLKALPSLHSPSPPSTYHLKDAERAVPSSQDAGP